MKLKRITALILSFILLIALCSCEEENPVTTETTEKSETTEAVTPKIPLLLDGKTEFKIIRSETAGGILNRALSAVYRELASEYPDAGFKVKSDYLSAGEAPYEYEILVGKTNREGSDAFRAEIPTDCFAIEVTEKTVRIDGRNESQIRRALEYFEKNYLTPDADGNIILELGKYISEPFVGEMSDIISASDKLTSASETVYDLRVINSKKTMQGGCTDGKYLYMFMVNPGDTQKAYIHKIDIETMQGVALSEELATDHSNDGTYVSKTNEIYICHNAPNRTKVTIVDADTLAFKKTVTIPFQIFSIAYEETRDVFVLGLSGGQDFTVVDRETFTVRKDIIPSGTRFTANNTGYTTQGVECDENYIYFVQYKQNVIMVYDWNGKFITQIKLDISGCEPENICLVDDIFYIGCNNSSFTSGVIYKTSIYAD